MRETTKLSNGFKIVVTGRVGHIVTSGTVDQNKKKTWGKKNKNGRK